MARTLARRPNAATIAVTWRVRADTRSPRSRAGRLEARCHVTLIYLRIIARTTVGDSADLGLASRCGDDRRWRWPCSAGERRGRRGRGPSLGVLGTRRVGVCADPLTRQRQWSGGAAHCDRRGQCASRGTVVRRRGARTAIDEGVIRRRAPGIVERLQGSSSADWDAASGVWVRDADGKLAGTGRWDDVARLRAPFGKGIAETPAHGVARAW